MAVLPTVPVASFSQSITQPKDADKTEFTVEQFNDFDAIFIGKITAVEEVDKGFYLKISFQPSKVFKGSSAGPITVYTPSQKTHGCGIKALAGESWLVLAEPETDTPDRLTTSYCVGSSKKLTNNPVIKEIEFLSEQRGGYFEWKYANGKVGGRGEMVEGKPNGDWEYYYPDGFLKSKGIYTNGLKEGEWSYYGPSKLLYKMNNDLDVLKNIMDSLWLTPTTAKHLAESGNYKLEPVYEDTSKHQVSRRGEVKKVAHYKDGRPDGKNITYYDNGQIEKEENYMNGRLHGTYMTYYSNGQVSREGNYSQGIPKGKWVDYNKNGSVRHQAVDAIPAYRATKDGMVPIVEKKTNGATSMK
ncbi:MAG: hypothetical protein H6585_12840 [Flavobacteriales bacterium]|nr:hypothetical protein [Flavobacteriales bacterium]MCB9449218.1 hypothetical protein [Flavobacteriales bacterium]